MTIAKWLELSEINVHNLRTAETLYPFQRARDSLSNCFFLSMHNYIDLD